jgi:hypothetical protein
MLTGAKCADWEDRMQKNHVKMPVDYCLASAPLTTAIWPQIVFVGQ